MITVDGSWGEGGGQILRTCLSIAAITGTPFSLTQIRAGRKQPGLAAQHLTSIRAAAALCQAEVRGDELGSMVLDFIPNSTAIAGSYHFDVTEAKKGGSAGSVSLILQTILLPLALAQGDSVVTIKGGTHVPFSPPITYLQEVYLPIVEKIGVQAEIKLKNWGWYPQGNGEVQLRVRGNSKLTGIELLERGKLQQIQGLAAVTQLPPHIPQRMVAKAEELLKQAHLKGKIQPLQARGFGNGAGIFLTAVYEHSRAGFSCLGKRGFPAEKVAEISMEHLLKFHCSDAAVDEFLGDQLLLPLALAEGNSRYKVAEITNHLTTNSWTISQLALAQVGIDSQSKTVNVTSG